MSWVRAHRLICRAGRGFNDKTINKELRQICSHADENNNDNTARRALFRPSVLTAAKGCDLRASTVGAMALVAGITLAQMPVAYAAPDGSLAQATRPASAPQQMLIRGIDFTGNDMISSARLAKVLPPLPAPARFATLTEISSRITKYYRAQGYPFARAYFPPQRSRNGILVLKIVEGHYGRVTVDNKSALSTRLAQRIVETNLCGQAEDCSGAPITSKGLQRASLILSDQPGVLAAGSFQRGDTFGTSDFNVVATPDRRFQFRGGVDNFGTTSTGDWRGSIGASANELLGRGDRLSLDLVGSGQQLWNGQVGYSLLLSPSGLRGGISGGRTHYELGGSFKGLDVNGYADTISVFLIYPVIRTLSSNLNAGLAYQHQSLHDNIGEVGYYARHVLDNAVISLNGNRADNFLGGGFNEFSFSFVYGNVHGLDAETLASDQDPQYGLFTRGSFNKFTFALDRQQNLPGPFSLFGSMNGQLASKNLASAERFYIGGPTGVRAYPVGEGSADSGVITTLELRYTVPFKPLPGSILTIASFYDNGWIRRNQDPPPGETKNTADYAGAGLRVGLEKQNRYGLNLIWAHCLGGETSQIDPGRDNSFWLQASFQY